MPRISTDNYDTVASWNGSQDLFVVEQPDGTKVATPAQVKQYILGDMDEVPTQNSNNPVKSGGIFSTMAVPKYDSTNRREYYEGGGAFGGNIDSTPTAGSNNAVASGGTKNYVDNAVATKTEYFISSSNNATQTINIGVISENRIFLFACGFHTTYVLELIAISANGANVVHVPVANSSINSISAISYNASAGAMTITVQNNPFGYGRMTRLS